MATQVIMPKLGLTMTEGRILDWLKHEGEPVRVGEPLLVVETDKVALDVEASASGALLKILHPAGDVVPLGTVIAFIGEPGEPLPQAPPSEPAAQENQAEATILPPAPPAAPAQPAPPVRVSPLARKLAAEHGIDLSTLHGSGPAGRIVEEDVRAVITAAAAAVTPPSAPDEAPYRDLPLSAVRRTSARRMAESARSAPHFYLTIEAVVAHLAGLLRSLQPDFAARLGVHLTYTDFFLRALALTLPHHPLLNAAAGDETVRCFTTVNLALAIAAPDGLVAPVIRSIEALSLEEIARRRMELAEKARSRRLTPDDLTRATFTLTNLGMYGVDEFAPILNPPQSAILAVGAVSERPVGEGGQVVLRPTVRLTLAVDHRVADGVDAALFLKELRALLSTPETLLKPT